MNFWNTRFANCDVPEESVQPVVSPPAKSQRGNSTKTGKKRGRQPSSVGGAEGTIVGEMSEREKEKAKAKSVKKSASSKKQQQWVQCERRSCQKWRKVAAHVDHASLPDKWYCEMNHWDPR